MPQPKNALEVMIDKACEMTAQEMNNRLFWCFMAGWWVGVLSGGAYGSYYWPTLQQHFGTALVIGVTSNTATTVLLATLVFRRMFKNG